MSRQPDYTDEERVIGAQARTLKGLWENGQAAALSLDDGIRRAEALAARLTATLPAPSIVTPVPMALRVPIPAFADLAAAAPRAAGLHDALNEDEIEATLARLHAAGGRPKGETALDRWDWMIAGSAGLLAGVADIVLVGLPQNPLTRFGSEGGPLSNSVRSAFDRILPSDTVAALEKAYPVPYDPSTNHRLLKPVPGLYPQSHRFHSLGHDPLLGWLFGVRDVFDGTFTAIGRDGVLVVQQMVEGSSGEGVFGGLLEAFRRTGGHMLSDISTPMGLPAPLMPLAQFFQFGSLGPEGYTVAEVARRMYLEGYDFRHFIAGGLTAAIVEVIIRGAWIARRLHEGCFFQTALPDAAIPRLRRQLLLGHATAAAVNAGKVACMQNPLALNLPQWLALLRYLGPELFHLLRAPVARASRREELLDVDLRVLMHGAHHLAKPRVPFWPTDI